MEKSSFENSIDQYSISLEEFDKFKTTLKIPFTNKVKLEIKKKKTLVEILIKI